jgi:ubiquinone/menaquinone biosynthesis C-methylase UbiE
MTARLKSGKFRWINEKLYTVDGQSAYELFQKNPELFSEYHEGFRSQTASWTFNPVDYYLKELGSLKGSTDLVVADLGCGEGKLAQNLHKRFKSFFSVDLVIAPGIQNLAGSLACDLGKVVFNNYQWAFSNSSQLSIQNSSVDIVVFSLSLMGTNFLDFLKEANRILKLRYKNDLQTEYLTRIFCTEENSKSPRLLAD